MTQIQTSSNPFISNAPRTSEIKDLRFIQVDVLNRPWKTVPSSAQVKS